MGAWYQAAAIILGGGVSPHCESPGLCLEPVESNQMWFLFFNLLSHRPQSVAWKEVGDPSSQPTPRQCSFHYSALWFIKQTLGFTPFNLHSVGGVRGSLLPFLDQSLSIRATGLLDVV